MKGRLAATIAGVAAELSDSGREALAVGLQSIAGPNAREAAGLSNLVPSQAFRAAVARLVEAWAVEAPGLPGAAVALALEAAGQSRRRAAAETKVQIVWTGPSTPAVAVRRTDRVLLDLINSAERELWLVCFAVHKVPEIVAALKAAGERGVRLHLVLESAEESAGQLQFDHLDALKKTLPEETRFLVWPADSRPRREDGRFGALHAKCSVADGRRLLVSSANLTEFALSLNMEMGLLVESEAIAGRVERHLSELAGSGILAVW
jgi:phosphatidylserine/phosphatidylglycerophosphate/cardiolipin synthase-like enzyme